MIAMLCVSSVAMEPSMRIGSVTVHSSLFAKMASESPEKDLITQSNIVKATDEMIQFEEKTVLDAKNLGIREYLVNPISPIALKKRICNVFGIKERV